MVATFCFHAPQPVHSCSFAFAVPLTVFLLDYCIRYPTVSMTDVAATELEVISSLDREYEAPNTSHNKAAYGKEVTKVQMGSQLGQLG